MGEDFDNALTMLKKGIEIKKRQLETEEFKIFGCTNFETVYMCSACPYTLNDDDCKKANDEKLYVKVKKEQEV